MQVHGSCHCGAVAYEGVVDPGRVTICHCTDCQVLTGTAYRVSVATSAEDFRLVRGTPKIYVKVGDSGNRRAQVFCPDCGSPLYVYTLSDAPPAVYGLRVGGLREREALVPTKRIWCRSALEWSSSLQGMETREKE